METTGFGIWAMLLFWASAVGGIALAISWARMKGRNPATRHLLEQSLKRRLEAGEISRQEFERKMAGLNRQQEKERGGGS